MQGLAIRLLQCLRQRQAYPGLAAGPAPCPSHPCLLSDADIRPAMTQEVNRRLRGRAKFDSRLAKRKGP